MARAALREPGLPQASLSGPEHDVRLLVDHRDDLVQERSRIQKRLRWNCHDLEVGLDLPPRVLDRYVRLDRLEEALDALPISSGKSDRHRLNRTGNRRLNSTIHMIAVTQARMHPPAIAFMEKRAEGMSTREALRRLKRHISRTLRCRSCRCRRVGLT